MKTKKVTVSLEVEAPEHVSPEEISELVGVMIDIGRADAVSTLDDLDDCGGDVRLAQMAVAIAVGDPVVARKPRVLVVVDGGVAYPTCDPGADVEVFDWDNYRDDPEGTGGVPRHFADLAELAHVPVEGEESHV